MHKPWSIQQYRVLGQGFRPIAHNSRRSARQKEASTIFSGLDTLNPKTLNPKPYPLSQRPWQYWPDSLELSSEHCGPKP